MFRKLGWVAMMSLGALVAAYAIVALLRPAIRSNVVSERLAAVPVALVVHLVAGSVAIVVGPFQLNGRLRARFLGIHRWMGRMYVVAVLAAGMAGLALARISMGGIVTHVGFGLLAVLWLVATAAAYRHIRARRTAAHRVWMIRSYALTFAAVTLRLYIPLGQIAGFSFEPAYQVISWLCWVPNLVVAEWFVLGSRFDWSEA